MSRGRLAWLIGEVASPWAAAGEDRLLARREHERLRAAGAGPGHDLPFTDRVIVTLVRPRFQLPHAALAELYRVHRSAVTRAIGEVRPLLAARGIAVPGEPGIRSPHRPGQLPGPSAQPSPQRGYRRSAPWRQQRGEPQNG